MQFPVEILDLIYQFARSRVLQEIHCDVCRSLINQKILYRFTPNVFLYSFKLPNKQTMLQELELDENEIDLIRTSNLSVKQSLKKMQKFYLNYFNLYCWDINCLHSRFDVDEWCLTIVNRCLKNIIQ
jgi:hypothetical protein